MRTATEEEGSTHTAAMLHGLHYYLKKHWHMRRAAHTAGRKWDSWIWVSLLPILRIFSTSCHFGGILAAAHYSIKGTHHLLYMGMRSRTQQVSVGFHEEGTIGKLPYTIREWERTHNFEKKKTSKSTTSNHSSRAQPATLKIPQPMHSVQQGKLERCLI